ncbi:NUDIX hydrolase [Kineococcus rubinsiae]|uniref:NUDIX hydrolase n=1 Tax=Kineococcus rubinsiae TaxID=2609562 RepID=UPI0014319AA6|nr:NUDIX domain-containing protein [Kineococcus rubinsiae]
MSAAVGDPQVVTAAASAQDAAAAWTTVAAAPADVEAAGCLVLRTRTGADGTGHREVLLVHRAATPLRGADWSWPKGKLEPGEPHAVAAVREVEEETGVRVGLSLPLAEHRYDLPDGRSKRVRYWFATPLPGEQAWTASPEEVDEVAWCRPEQARERLTFAADATLLDVLAGHLEAGLDPAQTWPLVLLRHARAVPRAAWDGEEAERPLLDTGHLQSRALAPLLGCWELRRAVTSPWARCVQTVLPAADAHGWAVEEDDALSEAGSAADPGAALDVLTGLLAEGGGSVVCSHGPVLPGLLAEVARRADVPAVADLLGPKLGKAELLVAHVAGRGSTARVVAGERHRV